MWSGDAGRALYHVSGRRDYEEFAAGGAKAVALAYRVVPFEERMPDLYRAADVCVTRAGAMTVAVKKSSIATRRRPTLMPDFSGIRSVESGLPFSAEKAVREFATVLIRMPNQATP